MRVAKISGEKRMRTEEGASFQNDPGVMFTMLSKYIVLVISGHVDKNVFF